MNKLLFVLFAVALLTACGNEDCLEQPSVAETAPVSIVGIKDGKIVPVSRVNNELCEVALAFADNSELENFKSTLEAESNDKQREIVRNYGVKSIFDLYEEADVELDSIGGKATSEDEFRALYKDYVEKYKGLLYANEADKSDLSLYLPNNQNGEMLVCNSQGLYVVGDKIIKANLSQPEFFNSPVTLTDPDPEGYDENKVNRIIFRPIEGKRVTFSLDRSETLVNLHTKFEKHMWYGWKKDNHHEIAFFMCTLSHDHSSESVIYPLSLSVNKGENNGIVAQVPVTKGFRGVAYVWTDYEYERDANGKVILVTTGSVQSPKVDMKKAKKCSFNLSRYGSRI